MSSEVSFAIALPIPEDQQLTTGELLEEVSRTSAQAEEVQASYVAECSLTPKERLEKYGTNLYRETRDKIRWEGRQTTDVHWVGTHIGSKDPYDCCTPCKYEPLWITWAQFREAANFYYDRGYGDQEINKYLMVVGSDWWLERHEYDGAECWEFKTIPKRPTQKIKTRDAREKLRQ